MKDTYGGLTIEDMPAETKAKFFCKFHQEKCGVICMNKLRCAKCGWNPEVEAKRKIILNEKEEVFKYDYQRGPAQERGE